VKWVHSRVVKCGAVLLLIAGCVDESAEQTSSIGSARTKASPAANGGDAERTAGTGAANGGDGELTAGTGAADSGRAADPVEAGAFDPCPTDAPCNILPLGDSITYGVGYDGGYRVELFDQAHAAGHDITFTGSLSNGPNTVDGLIFPKHNEGHGGWKINQLMPLIPEPALGQKPHIVLLMIGANDIGQQDDLANAPERLGALLDRLIANVPDALIVIAKLTPFPSMSDAVESYNAEIPAQVDARVAAGKHLKLVDMFTGFGVAMLGDSVHPNQQGYEHMARVWYDAISDLLH
jgi:lysophospholipase L1-like esterase